MIIDFARVRLGLPSLLFNTIQALPLPLFLLCVQWLHPAASSEWRAPYYVSTVAALLTTSIVWTRQTLNRICLGLNLYFVSGSIGLAAGWHWLNDFYGAVEATGMLIWIVAVGIATTFWSGTGFVGAVAGDKLVVKRFSLYLLAIALAVTSVSWYFQGNAALSAYLPFIILFTAHAMLRSRASSKVPSREKIP